MIRPSIRWQALVVVSLLLSSSAAVAQVLRQVTDTKYGFAGLPTIDDAGTTVYSVSNNNEFGDNPDHTPQLFRWNVASGLGSKLTNLPGIAGNVSVSDDGQWLAFSSTGDMLPEKNIDHSSEIFIIRSDNSGLQQLTNVLPPSIGQCYEAKIAGSGNRILFTATADLTGQNPSHNIELFIMGIDGKNLRQLTPSTPFDGKRFGDFAISDDGQRIAFVSPRNYLGTNADLADEAFVVNADGSSLRQLTASTAILIGAIDISGDASTVVFDYGRDLVPPVDLFSWQNIFAISYDGTNLRQVTSLQFTPGFFDISVTDDASKVYFLTDAQFAPAINPSGALQLWRTNLNGTGLAQLTFEEEAQFAGVAISGSGNQLVTLSFGVPPFSSSIGQSQLNLSGPDGSNAHELINVKGGAVYDLDLARDGKKLAIVSSDNPTGNNPAFQKQIWYGQTNGSPTVQLTTAPRGVYSVSISGNGGRIAYDDQYKSGYVQQVHTILSDGTGHLQLTSGSLSSVHPQISRDGSFIVFESSANLDGTEPSVISADVFAIRPNGTGLTRLTNRPNTGQSPNLMPRLDATATWFVYSSDDNPLGANPDGSLEIFRVKRDRTGRQQITSGPAGTASVLPDISGDGRLVVFASNANPLGTNPDQSQEVFVVDTQTSVLRQLTQTTAGDIRDLRLDESGTYVHFITSAPIAEFDPNRTADAYRIRLSDGTLERMSGIKLASGSALSIAASQDGEVTAFTAYGVQAGANLDLGPEVFMVDRSAQPKLRVNPDPNTIISWEAQPGPVRYDAIRGDVGNLAFNPDGTVNLGPVECLDDESVDIVTEVFREQQDPEPFPGRAFFFLLRPSFGLNLDIGTWGSSSSGDERRPSSGSCTN